MKQFGIYLCLVQETGAVYSMPCKLEHILEGLATPPSATLSTKIAAVSPNHIDYVGVNPARILSSIVSSDLFERAIVEIHTKTKYSRTSAIHTRQTTDA